MLTTPGQAETVAGRWLSLSPLAYLLAVFIGPATRDGGVAAWLTAAACCAVFTWLYFEFRTGLDRPGSPSGRGFSRARISVALMAALGLAAMPANPGAATFLVFAAGFAPLVWRPRVSIAVVCLLALAAAAEWAFSADADRLAIGSWVVFLIVMIGVANLFLGEQRRQALALKRAHEDAHELAKLAERERIARDLHDLLGHTLSVVTLKAELASKLSERDPARAAEEIREVERVSRAALGEVRMAVEGYRGHGLRGEIDNARRLLEAAGVEIHAEIGEASMSPRQEAALALVLREAVTNVVRHASAGACHVRLSKTKNMVSLVVEDDGIGGPVGAGHGVTGMRERIEAAGGAISFGGAKGLSISVQIPDGFGP